MKRNMVVVVLLIFFCLNENLNVKAQEVIASHEVSLYVKGISDLKTTEQNTKTEKNQESTMLEDYIPEGWALIEHYYDTVVTGDLDKDGIDDVAYVIEKNISEGKASNRKLVILKGQSDNSYIPMETADDVILNANQGGVWGDPFAGISIDRGSLLIQFYGGSNWRWDLRYRFRYQDNGFYLIGVTEEFYHTSTRAGRVYEDINLLTGDYIKIETDDNEVDTRIESNRGIKKLVNLADFNFSGARQY